MFGTGRTVIPPRKVTFWDTVKEIVFFCLLYGIAGALQLVILSVVAVLLGAFAGPVFLVLAVALNFSLGAFLDSRPFKFGIYIQPAYSDKVPTHVRLVQFLLVAFGSILTLALATGYLPSLWPVRVASFALESRWPWALEWHTVERVEIVTRALLLLGVPFVGWGAVTILKWAAQMEAVRPTFRETTHAPVDPGTVRGPQGEEYRRATYGRDDDDGGGDVVVIPPDY